MKGFRFTTFEKTAACLCLFLFIATRFFGLEIVSGLSMYPTYTDGDIIVSTKGAERGKINRGDIVIAEIGGRYLIKRAVAIPGDRLVISNGILYVNGNAEDGFPAMEDAGCASESITLGADEYFILGDNRNNSEDSRHFGPVGIDSIRGIALNKKGL